MFLILLKLLLNWVTQYLIFESNALIFLSNQLPPNKKYFLKVWFVVKRTQKLQFLLKHMYISTVNNIVIQS